MCVLTNKEDYFDEGEYILAHSAYASSEVVVPAYKSRVRIERCIGILTGEEMESLIKGVVACIILHNMLANIGDVWEELFMDDETPESHNTSTDSSTQSSIQMWERILPFVT
ncbi:hypothetical protein PPACK8108_LOCUS20504 [Phakopsora pachyrhizi]|uniref:DDE Tnp4 domain-containing protein n=1 Tax=Phakopsora pachyrhizi TaxID=170000 RepID=A0AAV0BF63_PHAPC|nr:hypothetical protein PPACK8108_LOCUS20504 [Phakopsora pachyrhizi]